MLARTIPLDPDEVLLAEKAAERKWGPDWRLKRLNHYFGAVAEPEPILSLNRRTYLVQVAPQMEDRVAETLVDAGFTVFVPREPKSVRVGHIKRRTIMQPMLPGYVFPIFDEQRDYWQVITRPDKDGKNGIKGVLRLFLWGDRPVSIPKKAIDDLRDREIEADMRGKAKKANTAAFIAMPGHFVQIDDGGPWNGFIGEVVDLLARGSRIVVALDLFGRQTPVEVSVNQVRAV